jgi:hypothetical protein
MNQIVAGLAGTRRLSGRTLEMTASAILIVVVATAVVIAATRHTLTRATRVSPFTKASGNLLDNPGFEHGLETWGAYPGTAFVRTTSASRFGFAAAEINASGVLAQPYGVYTFGLGKHTPAVGDRYAFSVWIKGTPTSAGKLARVEVNVIQPSVAERPVASTARRLSTNWQRLTAVGTIRPPGGRLVIGRVVMGTDVALGDTAYIDGARLRRIGGR